MWKLDKKTDSYSTKGTSWTWGKVSAEVLRYMRKKDNNVPTFVPLVLKDTSLTNMSTETIRYGRKLYMMTRTIYDALKKDPTLNILSLLNKTYSKETKNSKHKFGEPELETETHHQKHHHNHHHNETNKELEKQIQRLEHRLNEHDVQKVLIDKLKDCMRQIETLRRNVRKMIYGHMKHHENALKEQYAKIIEWEAVHGKKGEAISDPWNNASVHGWSQPAPLPTTTNPQLFDTQTPQVAQSMYDTFAMAPLSPTAVTSHIDPLTSVDLSTTLTQTTAVDTSKHSETKEETDILKDLIGDLGENPSALKDSLDKESKMEVQLLESTLNETDHEQEGKSKFGFVETNKPKLTLNLPSVVLNGKEEGDTNSVLTYLYKLLQNVVPQNKGSNDPNVQTNDEIIGECSLNANLLELQKTKVQDHRCCMINVNVPIMPQPQP